MNFKSLALGSVLALGSIFGGVQSAQAGTCWYMDAYENGSTSATYCSVESRVNSNGHRVFDIVDGEGDKFTVVLWTDGVAEVIGIGDTQRPQQVEYYRDADGDPRLVWPNGFEFSFRY